MWVIGDIPLQAVLMFDIKQGFVIVKVLSLPVPIHCIFRALCARFIPPRLGYEMFEVVLLMRALSTCHLSVSLPHKRLSSSGTGSAKRCGTRFNAGAPTVTAYRSVKRSKAHVTQANETHNGRGRGWFFSGVSGPISGWPAATSGTERERQIGQ